MEFTSTRTRIPAHDHAHTHAHAHPQVVPLCTRRLAKTITKTRTITAAPSNNRRRRRLLQTWGWDLHGASPEEEARKLSSSRRCAPGQYSWNTCSALP